MLATTALAFLRAVSSSATCPACSAPIVGTNATFLRDILARSARHSAIVRTTCMGRKLYGDPAPWPTAAEQCRANLVFELRAIGETRKGEHEVRPYIQPNATPAAEPPTHQDDASSSRFEASQLTS